MVLMQRAWNQTDIALEHWPSDSYQKKEKSDWKKVIPNNSFNKRKLKKTTIQFILRGWSAFYA